MSTKNLVSLTLLVCLNLFVNGRRHRGLPKDDVQMTSSWWPRSSFSVTEQSEVERLFLQQPPPPKVPPRPVLSDPKWQKVFRATERNATWPYREQVVVVEGDIILGGLMMVHERHNELICGKVMPQGGIQATEAMLYTIDYVNRIQLIPGIRIGARIKDDCDRDIYGLEQSVDFIRGNTLNRTRHPQPPEIPLVAMSSYRHSHFSIIVISHIGLIIISHYRH